MGKQTKRFEIVIHIFINHGTKFSPNPHLVEEATCFLSLHLDIVQTDLHSFMPLQGPKCYIPLELACCFLVVSAMSLVIENHTFVR